ncbi:hypothetical protein V5799_012568 [Amblyomma americanum]|uniref:Secreted protein n=1 Tax=Amblyomma americanum TaxID=6943 RepID=A0AAQ4EDQ7_AMBAM
MNLLAIVDLMLSVSLLASKGNGMVSCKYKMISQNQQDDIPQQTLNFSDPWETAVATKRVTDAFFKCKKDIFELNIKSAFIKEVDRCCYIIRICHAYASDLNMASCFFSTMAV